MPRKARALVKSGFSNRNSRDSLRISPTSSRSTIPMKPHARSHSATLPRRAFLAKAAGAALAPFILPSLLRGQDAPSVQHVLDGAIGTGRMGRTDMKLLLDAGMNTGARLVAVCDADKNRAADAKKMVDDYYAAKLGKADWNCAVFADHRALLAHSGLDGVMIATPDHQHAHIAIDAAAAKKHIYLEKPLTYSHAEGQRLVKAVREHKVVLQTGSMQRSSKRFRQARELAINGRLGKVHTITVQLPQDQGTGNPATMPVPANLDFNRWLGPRPLAPYSEDRVHPQNGLGRPGWLQIEDYCLGMITGWGAHMFDIAQWGNGSDNSGLVEIQAKGEFPDRGLFNVHTNFTAEGTFANGTRLLAKSGDAGVWFEGDKGKLFVSRDILRTEPRALAKETIGDSEIRLYASDNHMADFLTCARDGKDPICPVETGHRSNTLCIITHIAMKTGRKLAWDPVAEKFTGDDAANAMLDYTPRDWENA